MKTKLHSSCSLPACFALLAAITVCLAALPALAQNDTVTISAAEFQRLVYAAHLHTQLAAKPELEASLQVLLEMQRRNPQRDPVVLAGVLTNALQIYRTSAPYYIRTNGYADEILAAYLEALRQVPARTNFIPANLTLLSNFMLGPADYNPDLTAAQQFDPLIDSGNQRLFSSQGQAIKRQALVDNCVARAQGNAGFARAMDGVLTNEVRFSLAALPTTIIGSTNSPLHDNQTMHTLLSLTNLDGSLTVSSNQLMTFFNNEMQTFQDISHTNLALLAQMNQSQPDLLAYLTDQAAIDANVALQAAVQQGQPAKLASATAVALVQSKLLSVNTESAGIEGTVSAVAGIATGIASLCLKNPAGFSSVLAGGLDVFNMFTGNQTPANAMAAQISNIQSLVSDLSANVNYRFDRVDQSLTTIFDSLNTNFSRIQITLDGRFETLQYSVDNIRKDLLDAQASLNRIESEMFTLFAQSQRLALDQSMNGALFYELRHPNSGPMSQATYIQIPDGPENTFLTYATSTAAGEASSPSASLDLSDAMLESTLAGGHADGKLHDLDAKLNYLRAFLSAHLGLSATTSPPLANPRDWFAGAYAYLQLAAENPMLFRYNGLTMGAISNVGTNLTDFFRSLTFTGTNINWPFYANLDNYYAANLISFNAQVAATEQQYANSNRFALGTWRQWDAAAPRVTAATTKVLGAPEIPSIVPREPVTNIAAGLGFCLALKADRTVVGWGDNTSGQTTIPAGLTNVVAIAAGYSNSLALTADGTVIGWGDNTAGQTNVPTGLRNVVAIAAGAYHSLALKADRTVVGWGNNGHGQTNVPTGLTNVVAIAASEAHSLALKTDGTVVGWGNNAYGQTNVPTGLTNVVAIAAGDYHNLALRADGTVVGWGNNYYGQVNGVPMPYPPFTNSGVVMVATQVLANVVGIAAGQSYSLARLRDGTVFGWGCNYFGQATGVPSHQVPPIGSGAVKVAGQTLSHVAAIVAGGEHSLALKADGTVVAWGDNQHRQCVLPSSMTWRGAIAAGAYHNLALKADGTVVGWGNNEDGKISIPAGLTNVVAIDAANDSLALKADGTVVGWGRNDFGEAIIPTNLTDVAAIAAGGWHTLALKANGTVAGWGYNGYGETKTTGLTNVVAISAGFEFSLALKTDGTVVAWGNNGDGQTNVPAGLTNVVAISAGSDFSLALKADGTVVAWGGNDQGQTNVPAGLTDVVAIAADGAHSLALKADGTVVAWGWNYYGQTDIPAGLTNVVVISAGVHHSLALQADGTIVGWGNNVYGQTNVPALPNVVAVAAGDKHSLALKADGTVAAWGDNYYGQTELPASLTNVVAIAAGGSASLALKADRTVVAWGDTDGYYGQTWVPASLTNVVAIAVGSAHSLALRADGTVFGWGVNIDGRATGVLSQNPPVYTDADVVRRGQVLSNVVAIAAGEAHSLALKADGSVVGWGNNYSGQTSAPSLTNAVAIAAGELHSLALKADGTVVGWGYNSSGQRTIPTGLTNVVAIAAGNYCSLALKADGTVVAWGDNTYGQTNFPAGLTNVVAIAAGEDHSLCLTVTDTGGSVGNGDLSLVRAQIPYRVTALFQGSNRNMTNELGALGTLYSPAQALTGAKLLIQAVLELGMPYTLERDEVLHGFLYGSESLVDTIGANNFLVTQNAQLQASPQAPPQALTQVAALRYQCFVNQLNQCLTNLQATGQPETPRLVGHTLRLLNLLRDAWTQPTNSPPPALEMWSEVNSPRLLLYGEPYMNYTLQYRDTLRLPWTSTTITNLQDGPNTNLPPFSASPQRFYRTVLPMP